MWVVFRKSDKQVVGSSVDAGVDLTKEDALNGVVEGLIDRLEPSEYDAVEVNDPVGLAVLARALSRGTAKVKELTEGKLDVADESPEGSFLTVTTNATQFHPVDRVPLIPADGTSFLVITLQKVSLQGTPLTRQTIDNEVIWLRTICGSLREDTTAPAGGGKQEISDTEGPREIRSVTLASGTARFRLYSETAKRLATVEMLSANHEMRLGGLRVEFI